MDWQKLERDFDESKANCDNWSKKEWYAFIIVVSVVCLAIQLLMRAFR